MPVPSVRYKPDDEVWVAVTDVEAAHPAFQAPADAAVVVGKLLGRVENENAGPGVPRTWHVSIAGVADVHGIVTPIQISSRRFHRHAKILIVRIGDWKTEQQTLNPLSDSLKSQLSLLLPPGFVDVEYIRTLDELAGALRKHGGGGGPASHVPWGYAVLVGHGRSGADAGIDFAGRWHTAQEVANSISGLGPGRKSFSEARFVSVCCHTGSSEFASSFSDELGTTWVGPRTSVHSYEAAGFVWRLFYEHFLRGRTWADAFRHTRSASATYSTDFRCWADGDENQPA